MAVHNTLTGSELHEVKGAAAATKGFALIADGAGSAVFLDPLGAQTVIVRDITDLPAASGGTITLAINTNYIFSGTINLGSDFITVADNTNITCRSFFAPALTYTGTGSMFVGVDANFTIRLVRLTCNTAQVFDMSESGGGGTKTFQCSEIVVTKCTKWGTFDKLLEQSCINSRGDDCADGITLLGSVSRLSKFAELSLVGTSTSFIGVDFGTSVQKSVDLSDMVLEGGAGSIGLKGAAASANITTGFLANVTNVQFTGVTTPLSVITVDDIRWNFQGNGVVSDTMPDALISLTLNATATTLAVGVPTLVAGTWSLERVSFFTTTTAGRATYNGERDLVTPIDAAIVIDPASGTNKSIRAYIALNGTVITNSGVAVNISSGDPKEIVVHWQLNLSTADFIEVFIENETDSVNCTVVDATLRLR